MSLTLPTAPPPASMDVGIVSARNSLTAATGGSEQELRRKGSRYALTFAMPPMTYVQAMDWGDLKAEGETVVMRVYQPGLFIGDDAGIGTPRIKGGAQIGASVLIDGMMPGYVVRKDQFLSIITGGQRFLYQASAAVAADGAGEMVVPLRHLLRRSPADNDVVEIAQPMIEGFPRDVADVSVGVERLVYLTFTVRERE